MQQISFIDLFKLAVHVSGDKLAHRQEQFLTVYTAFGITHRYCCRPVSPVGSNIGALYRIKTDRQTNMTKLTVTFRYFAHTRKTNIYIKRNTQIYPVDRSRRF